MTTAMADTNAIASTAQPTAIAAVAASQSSAPFSSSQCGCQCMCPSAGFQMSPSLQAVVATPEVQMSSPEFMILLTNAGQSSLPSIASQPATTSTMITQQANVDRTASTASSTPEITQPAQTASPATESPAPLPVATIATPMTLSANPPSSTKTSMAPAFNINTYPLSSAVTAPVVLET